MHRIDLKSLSSLAVISLVLTSGCGDDTGGFFFFQDAQSSAPDGAGGGLDDGSRPGDGGGPNPLDADMPQSRRVVIFVWDGLRPDSVDAVNTPRLASMAAQGVWFADNHATYPTFTMMNAASFATGNFPGATGFYGNTLWQEGPTGNDSAGATVDFDQPVFTEDYAILLDLQTYYGGKLFLIGTLFQAAQKAGLVTATVGKSGSAFLQDIGEGGYILDEKFAYPLAFAKEIQSAGRALPRLTPNAYSTGSITLASTNGDPTGAQGRRNFSDNSTADPTDQGGTPYHNANSYMMGVYLDIVLSQKAPDLTLIWFRNPDSTEHAYGPGTANYRDSLKSQDQLLGMLEDKLGTLGMTASTDVIVVSDHGHSSVSGPLDLFPLRAVKPDPSGVGNTTGDIDPNGFSVSGDVRLAHLLAQAGFTAYDGAGCTFDPVMSGILADGTQLYPTKFDTGGSICGTVSKRHNTPSYRVPTGPLPAQSIVIAANGGSEYLYIPDHDATTVTNVVRFLQSREEIGALFLASRYGNLPGTLPLDQVRLENSAGRSPDIVASYDFDEHAVVQGVRGTEFESAQNYRGMHGSFSPLDVQNTLVARGPRFKSAMQNALPSGNVDVAPTVATILGLALPSAAGRSLDEALVAGKAVTDYTVTPSTIAPTASATGLSMVLPTNAPDPTKTTYTFQLKVKDLTVGGQTYRYFDSAKAIRQ